MQYAIGFGLFLLVGENIAVFMAGRKHGQQVVLKALAQYHNAMAVGSGVKQAFVNFVEEFKSKF